MKKAFAIGISILLFFFSCNNDSNNKDVESVDNPQITDIDSTNIKGDAPVRYSGDDPDDTGSKFPTRDDTGRRENTKAEFEQ